MSISDQRFLDPYLSTLSSIHSLISFNTRFAFSSGSPWINEWYIPSYSFKLLSSLTAFSYKSFDDVGHVTPSEVPCTVKNGAVTFSKLSCMYWHTLASSLIVPTLGFPVYLLGFEAIIFNFSGSLIAFPTILLSGMAAHVSAIPNSIPYMKSLTLLGFMFSGMTKSGAEKIRPVHASGGDWKYMSIAVAPPMDSPKRKAGRSLYGSLLRMWRKKDRELPAIFSMSPR